MKKLLLVAFAATVALFATSCKKAGEAPKAAFDYSVDGLTVTFTNLSKNADSYTWDFGDKETSTEKNPVHTYAANGEYTVVLTASNKDGKVQATETISMKTAAIQIDGSFADWDAVKAAGKGVYTELANGVEYEMTAISKFAAYMDADFIYFMLVYDPTQVMPLDMYLGCSGEREDADPCTHYWSPMYCDYLVEFGKGDTFEEDPAKMDWFDWTYCTQFQFDVETGGWAFTQLAQNICTISNKIALADGTYVEGKMARANFKMTAPYVYISCNTSDEGWGGSGMAPAAILEEGAAVYQPQLKLEEAE